MFSLLSLLSVVLSTSSTGPLPIDEKVIPADGCIFNMTNTENGFKMKVTIPSNQLVYKQDPITKKFILWHRLTEDQTFEVVRVTHEAKRFIISPQDHADIEIPSFTLLTTVDTQIEYLTKAITTVTQPEYSQYWIDIFGFLNPTKSTSMISETTADVPVINVKTFEVETISKDTAVFVDMSNFNMKHVKSTFRFVNINDRMPVLKAC